MMAVPMLISCKQSKKCCFAVVVVVVVVVVCLFLSFFCRGMKEEIGWYSPTGSSLIMVESDACYRR